MVISIIIDMDLFSVIFHHGEHFINGNHMFYRGGNETIVEGLDTDMWSFLEVVTFVKELGYNEFRLWRKIPGLDKGFAQFIDYVKAEEIAKHNLDNYVDGYIWVEHDVEDMLSNVLRHNIEQISEGSDDVSIDDDVIGVKFDDNEEERTCERNELFFKVTLERPTNGKRVKVNDKSLRFKVNDNKLQRI